MITKNESSMTGSPCGVRWRMSWPDRYIAIVRQPESYQSWSRHLRAVGGEPRDVLHVVATSRLTGEERVLPEHRMRSTQRDDRAE